MTRESKWNLVDSEYSGSWLFLFYSIWTQKFSFRNDKIQLCTDNYDYLKIFFMSSYVKFIWDAGNGSQWLRITGTRESSNQALERGAFFIKHNLLNLFCGFIPFWVGMARSRCLLSEVTACPISQCSSLGWRAGILFTQVVPRCSVVQWLRWVCAHPTSQECTRMAQSTLCEQYHLSPP